MEDCGKIKIVVPLMCIEFLTENINPIKFIKPYAWVPHTEKKFRIYFFTLKLIFKKILNYFQFNLFKNINDLNLLENLEKFKSLSVKDNERVKVFCINSKINPIPNSTADKTKKKMLKTAYLSYRTINLWVKLWRIK